MQLLTVPVVLVVSPKSVKTIEEKMYYVKPRPSKMIIINSISKNDYNRWKSSSKHYIMSRNY